MKPETELSVKRTPMFNGINGFGRMLKSVGLDPFKLDAEKIIRKSIRKAGYRGLLPGQTEEGLKILVDSILKEGDPNPFGLLAVSKLFERTLYGRLKVEQVLKADPQIEEVEIKEPVFIIGMPRTGTTILHALLHLDDDHRSPLAWECLLPYPVPKPENFHNNSQVKRIRKDFDQLFKLVPDFQVKHYMEADSPQECLGINMLDFNSFQALVLFYIPTYSDWFHNRADKLETMRFHKRFLQYLQSGGVKSKRWLLKTPAHLMRLPELFEVYPDARIIMTHREPEKVVASTASLLTSVRSLYSDSEDPVRTGREQLDIWSSYFEKFLDSLENSGKKDQVIHIRFDDFVKDQIGEIQKIYSYFGWEMSEASLERKRKFLAENPKGKNGVHVYTPEDFGLTKEMIDRKFGHYLDFLNDL